MNSRKENKTVWASLKKHALPIILGVIVLDVVLIAFFVRALMSGSLAGTLAKPTAMSADIPYTPEQTATLDIPSTPLPATDTPAQPSPPSTLSPTLPPTFTPIPQPFFEGPFTYGTSYSGRPLLAFRLGSGPSVRFIIGAIHGGYEWNTVDLVSKTLTHLQDNPSLIPPNVTLYIIPCANPDGYAAGTDPVVARMNGNGVDLNRNWDYHWQMTATHGTRPIKAGSGPFSEPETAFLRDLIEGKGAELAIFYHSAMAKIYSGAERDKAPTYELAEMMSAATGYPHAPEGVPGQITTGDAIDYLSLKGIAAVEVELTNHQDIEWDKNLPGVLAFLNWTIPGQAAAATPMPLDGPCITYTIKPGDTLLGIALKYGVSLDELMRFNGLTNDIIMIGYTLCIPTSNKDQ